MIDTNSTNAADIALRRDGYAVLKGVFEPARIDQIREWFLAEYASRDRQWIRENCLRNGHRRWMFTLALEEPLFVPSVYASDRLMPLINEQLGEDALLQSMMVVNASPGARMGGLHVDYSPLFPQAGAVNGMLPPFAFQVSIPLLDLDETTGSTAIWPGSHRQTDFDSTQKPQDLDALKGADVPYIQRGDCFITDYRVFHRGTANTSPHPRPILYLLYTRSWFRDHQNYQRQPRMILTERQLSDVPEKHQGLFVHLLRGDVGFG